jgi:hypothetical protein
VWLRWSSARVPKSRVPSPCRRQHCLYLRPEPHQQGAVRRRPRRHRDGDGAQVRVGVERAVPLDTPAVLVPRPADVSGHVRPPRNKDAELLLGPEHREGRCGVLVGAVDAGGTSLPHSSRRPSVTEHRFPAVRASTMSSTGRSTASARHCRTTSAARSSAKSGEYSSMDSEPTSRRRCKPCRMPTAISGAGRPAQLRVPLQIRLRMRIRRTRSDGRISGGPSLGRHVGHRCYFHDQEFVQSPSGWNLRQSLIESRPRCTSRGSAA